MPGNWDGTPILRGLPGPAAIPDAAPVANVKRGKYHKLEPELKYQFFETHRLLKNKSIRKTMAWFNEHLPLVYCTEGNLTLNIVEKWRTKYSERPVPPPVEKAEEKIKPGPKKRALKFGEFEPFNKKRVSVASLMMLAAMLVTQVVAGVPMTTPIMLTSTLAIFGNLPRVCSAVCVVSCNIWIAAVFCVQHGRDWSPFFAIEGQDLGREGRKTGRHYRTG
jgi:hypothetical protein